MSKLTCCKPFRRALAAVAILCAAALPQSAAAQAANPWFTARLDFSADVLNFETAGVHFASSSPYVSLIQQGNQVTGIQWGIGQITLNQGNLTKVDSLGPTEQFSMIVGNETLMFQLGSVMTNYGQFGQVGLTLGVTGSPAPYYDPGNNVIALVSQDFQTTQAFSFPINNDPAQGRFVANSMRMLSIPFASDPAFGLLDAVSRGNFGMTPNMTRDQIYAMNLGTLTISAVPEPTSAVMLLLGLGVLGGMARRRQATT
jgi:hypothetical protein